LPLEIITLISLRLSTADYLNARLAFPLFLPVFNTQKFWHSRFLPNAERSWGFESHDWEISPCNWLWCYRRTANGSPSMKNRERVWRLVEKLKTILCLEWTEPISSSLAHPSNTAWLQATGDVRPETQLPYKGFDGGCVKFRERQVDIPTGELTHLAFPSSQLGGTT
jgi:hypothetical protein